MKNLPILFALIIAKAGYMLFGNSNSSPQSSFHEITQDAWLVKLDTNSQTTTVNWPVLKSLVTSTANLKSFCGTDSVDYLSELCYNTPAKALGFERSTIKRIKKNGSWAYEAFLKMNSDSNKVRNVFFSLYDELKKTIAENSGTDFILGSSAKMPISAQSVNWMAMWTLYTNYKSFEPGLPKVRVTLLLSGLPDMINPAKMDYTIKIFVYDGDYKIAFFTWDKPRT